VGGAVGRRVQVPAREVVGGIYAISRGMGLEALLADERDSGEQFEELPTLPRATLMDNFDRTVTEPRLRRIAAVDGRSDDVITLPAAGGRVAVLPFRLRAPFSELPEVRQYQVGHDLAGLRVAVVLRDRAPTETPGPGPRAPGRRGGPAAHRGHPCPRDRA
jgi:hypothetical protein